MSLTTACVAVLVVSAAGTLLARWWALRTAQLDVPGSRRLHVEPTPRGGGLGPVIAWLVVLSGVLVDAGTVLSQPSQGSVVAALILVALIGAVDDRHDLSILPRLLTHALAAALVAMSFVGDFSSVTALLAIVVLTIGGVASINLHNFMDGANGFLSWQGLFVALALATLAGLRGDMAFVSIGLLIAVALLGFLPFNFPRAKIFLGDLGSGSIGLMIGALSLVAVDRGLLGWGSVLILSSGFMVDAGATLCMRMSRTSRWAQGHRSHLYQMLWRRGWRAPAISAVYQCWNVLVVVPVLLVLERYADSLFWEFGATVVVYLLGLLLWMAARRALWSAHRAQYRP